MKKLLVLSTAIAALSATNAQAADVLNPGSGTPYVLSSAVYTQDFNTLKSVTSDPTSANYLPEGWQSFESGDATADDQYKFGSSGSNTPGIWSYGSGKERALGMHADTQVSQMYIGAVFQNALGGTINGLNIGYTGEQWQDGFNRATMNFQYSLDATDITSGTWTSFSDLDFLAPSAIQQSYKFGITSRNGNSAAYSDRLNGTINGLSIAAGQNFAVRWSVTDIDRAGVSSDDGLGVDDFRLSASVAAAVPEPATWAMMIGGFGVVGGALRRRRSADARKAFA